MDYKTFEETIISKIQKNKSCSSTLKKNGKLVNEYFHNPSVVNSFITKLNDAIIEGKKFDEIEKFLNDPSVSEINTAFKQSDILIKACEAKNKKAAKWLLKMNIDLSVRDKNGMTALMHASRYWDLQSIVEKLIEKDETLANAVDNDGNTALFHSVKINAIFDVLVKCKADVNYRNKNGDTIFTHICKNHKPRLIRSLLTYHKDVDFSVVNNEGRTGAMYLAESDNYTEIRALYATKRDLNLNYKNEKNETIVSLTLNRIYSRFSKCAFHDKYVDHYTDDNFKDGKDYRDGTICARTINALIDTGCDFNCVVDGDGNTPLMVFIMIQDYVSALNLLKYCKTMDLTICNKYGVNAAHLGNMLTEDNFVPLKNVKNHIFMEIDYKIFKRELEYYPTYKKGLEINLPPNTSIISSYDVPDKILSFQASLSEGYLARNGEDSNPDLFDKLAGPLLGLQISNPKKYNVL